METQALCCLRALKFVSKTICFCVKTFLLALFLFSFPPALCSALAEGVSQPSACGPLLRGPTCAVVLQGPFSLYS